MKKMLLLLGVLIFAVPAWAADTAGAPAVNPSASASFGQATQPGKETPKKAHKKKKKKKAKSAATESATSSCPQQCRNMNCPPPGGPLKLCCPVAPYTQTCP